MLRYTSSSTAENNLALSSALKKNDNIMPVFILGCKMIGRFNTSDTLFTQHQACLKKVIVDINNN